MIIYRTEAGWLAAQQSWQLRRQNGIAWTELDGEALPTLDPALGAGLHRGVLLPRNGHVTDPQAVVTRLAEAFVRDGGHLLASSAVGFAIEGGRLRGVVSPNGTVPAEAAVVAAGIHSRALAAQTGDKLPLESERGYQLHLAAPSAMPRFPTVHAEDRFVATPMATGLRLTGIVELAGLDAPPDRRRAHALLPLARRLYPGLSGEGEHSIWMGHRPSLPDSLPAIGRSTRSPHVIYAFGHGHLALTAAPLTGRLVAELIAGRPTAIDLAPFAPTRFRRR